MLDIAPFNQPWWPFAIVLISVAFIIVAIAKFKLHAMLALIMAALLAGLLTGKTEWNIVQKDGSIKKQTQLVGPVELTAKGLGDTARDIAISVALASIIGMCLMESGGAEKVVQTFLKLFGENRAGMALLTATYILSIPIFFDTMFMLMAPLAKALGRRTGKDYMLYTMCVCCGGVITHSMTIPHPGPLAMVDSLAIDPGISLLAGLVIGVVPAILGYFVCVMINRFVPVAAPNSNADDEVGKSNVGLPSLFWSLVPVLLPIFLIALSSIAMILDKAKVMESIKGTIGDEPYTVLRNIVDFIGHKNIALFVGAFISLWVLARQCGLNFEQLEKRVGPPLETAGMIILITSAGGAFGTMLREIGIGEAVERQTAGANISLLILAWCIAAVVRIAQGSATVSMQTTVGIILPMIATLDCDRAYLFLAIGWGAMAGSWMNDSGFWVVSRVGELTQKETLKSWTVLLMSISIIGLVTTYLVSRIMPFPFGQG
jgi:gluconate:H+ symporter, GntP family